MFEKVIHNSKREGQQYLTNGWDKEDDETEVHTCQQSLWGSLQESIQQTNIQEYYKNETVFITGSTGFLGTLLVEKLLRCCPQVRKLILLVRNKRGQSVEERVKELFNEEVFDRMRLLHPDYHEKVDIVCGAIEEDNFGLCQDEIRRLTAQTSIIFHVAATVRFDEHIRIAYNINVKGTSTVISLARKMPHLKSLVHVSTAYCHCDRLYIEEKFYPPVFTERELATIMANANDEEIALLNHHLLGPKPNSYTSTKTVAEELIREVADELPVCVFRPSVVFPTLQDPLPMWMKGFNAVLAMSLAGGVGISRVNLNGANLSLEIVPGDLTINALTALPWFQSTHKSAKKIVNYVSVNDNRVNMEQFVTCAMRTMHAEKESCKEVVWWPHVTHTNSGILYCTLFYLCHSGMAVVLATIEKLANQKPRILKTYRKIFYFMKIMQKFVLTEWAFESDTSQALSDSLSREDRVMFESSLSSFNWNTIFIHVPRFSFLYILNTRINKEYYRNHTVYLKWAHSFMWFSVLTFSLYFALSYLLKFWSST